jgi:hypothetical protein
LIYISSPYPLSLRERVGVRGCTVAPPFILKQESIHEHTADH